MSRNPSSARVKVFTAGCYNRIHKAHLRMLLTARTLGDELVLVLANDAHNRKPAAVSARVRRRNLEALGLADRVVVGRPDSFALSLRKERPSIVALGYDQRLPDLETEKAVTELGIAVVTLPWYPGKEEAP